MTQCPCKDFIYCSNLLAFSPAHLVSSCTHPTSPYPKSQCHEVGLRCKMSSPVWIYTFVTFLLLTVCKIWPCVHITSYNRTYSSTSWLLLSLLLSLLILWPCQGSYIWIRRVLGAKFGHVSDWSLGSGVQVHNCTGAQLHNCIAHWIGFDLVCCALMVHLWASSSLLVALKPVWSNFYGQGAGQHQHEYLQNSLMCHTSCLWSIIFLNT